MEQDRKKALTMRKLNFLSESLLLH